LSEEKTKEWYQRKAKQLMNMTPGSARKWQRSQAYKEYRRYRDGQRYNGYTDDVVERAIRVYRGRASKEDSRKVYSYLKRNRYDEKGEARFGSGNTSVSADTAADRNWLWDPTGRFSE